MGDVAYLSRICAELDLGDNCIVF